MGADLVGTRVYPAKDAGSALASGAERGAVADAAAQADPAYAGVAAPEGPYAERVGALGKADALPLPRSQSQCSDISQVAPMLTLQGLQYPPPSQGRKGDLSVSLFYTLFTYFSEIVWSKDVFE